jgi:hypothetical protein
MQDELAGTATRREAEIERSVREHAAGIERLTASVQELVEASADRMAGLSEHVEEQRVRAEELAAEKMGVLDELILRVQALETSTAQHIVELDERSARVTELAHGKLIELGDVARATSEELRIKVDRGLAEGDAAIADQLEVARGAQLGELDQRAASGSADVAVAAVAWTQQAHEGIDARVAAFESTVSATRASLANTAAELRTELEAVREELGTQLRDDVERQVSGLERAGTAWLGRIDQAGKKRRAHVRRRRAAPPAAVLAAGAVVTGALGTGGRSLEPLTAAGVPATAHAVDGTIEPRAEPVADTPITSSVVTARLSDTPERVAASTDHADPPTPTPEQPTLLDGVLPAAACDALEQLDLDC